MTFPELTRTARINGVDLAWEQWGSPTAEPTLVVCHGFSGSGHDFSLHVEALAHDRQVIALDHRGHGRSTKTRDLVSYTITQLTADLIGLVEATCDVPVDLLGHSMGGAMSIRLAVERPDLLRSLIAMDTSAWEFVKPDSDIANMMGAFFSGFDPADGLPSLDLPSPETVLIDAATPQAWRDRKEQLSAGFDPYALKGLGLALFTNDMEPVRDRLGEIAFPVTVIAGEHDHPFVGQAPVFASEVADGQCTIIGGAYHSPQLTHPTEWRAAVQTHLSWVAARV